MRSFAIVIRRAYFEAKKRRKYAKNVVVNISAFKGFQYGKDKQMDTKIYWKCDSRACKGLVVTSSGEPVTILKETPHNLHGPSVAEIEIKKSLARMKEVAAQDQDAPSRILNRELQGSLPAENRPYLPKEATADLFTLKVAYV